MRLTCGNCGREIRGPRSGCIYCGWSTPGASEPAERLRDEPLEPARIYRAGQTLGPFVAAAIIFGMIAVALIKSVGDDLPRSEGRTLRLAWAVFCIFLGPLSCLVQVLRRRTLWLRLDPQQGVITSRGLIIPWRSIESVEHRPGPFGSRGPFRLSPGMLIAAGCSGCYGVFALLVIGAFRIILLPVVSVLSPWHARVTIQLRDGDRLVYRDLEEADDLVHRIRMHLQAHPPGMPPPEAQS